MKETLPKEILNMPIPDTDFFTIDSLSHYIEKITSLIGGKWADKQEEQRKLLTGQNFIDDFLAGIENEDVKERLSAYRKYIWNHDAYKPVKNFKSAEMFFYRGQDNRNYILSPSALRNNQENEDYIYHEIMVRCPEYFRSSSHLDRLVTMQHFCTPTRLLDITSNPLTALYFACQPSNKKDKDEPEPDGKVFVFGLKRKQVLYSDSDRVLILSCIPRLSSEDKKALLQNVNIRLNGNNKDGLGKNYSASAERLYHEITTEQPSFKKEIKPIDLINPVFVKPSKSNPRILKQDGAFVLSGLNSSDREAACKINQYVLAYILIPGKLKEDILKDLDMIGINKASLFPDLENTGAYLKKQYQ